MVNIKETASGGNPAACSTMRIATGATEGTPADPIDAIVAAKLKTEMRAGVYIHTQLSGDHIGVKFSVAV